MKVGHQERLSLPVACSDDKKVPWIDCRETMLEDNTLTSDKHLCSTSFSSWPSVRSRLWAKVGVR